ncbi:MAG: hypothetical protein EBU33_03315 [Sphingobacteriia bacterium]|nr:hypothetical protein [Sphingobacteriia bacterium]
MITIFIIAALAGIGVYWKIQRSERPPHQFCINYCYDSDDDSTVISYGIETLEECKPIMENSKKTMWISIN